MAITTTISWKSVFGNKRVHYGKSVLSGGVTSGDVNTGLQKCEGFIVCPYNATAQECAVNEDLSSPVDGTAVTIIGESDATLYWLAIGH